MTQNPSQLYITLGPVLMVNNVITDLGETTKSQVILKTYAMALEPYGDEAIQAALLKALRTKFDYKPTPGDIAELVRESLGVSKAQLKRDGGCRYLTLSGMSLGYDLITDDWRVVYAIKKAFGSLYGFAKDQTPDHLRKREFVDAYCAVCYEDSFSTPKEYYLKGYAQKSGTGQRHLSFLGDYQACLNIAKQRPDFDTFQLPRDPNAPKPQLLTRSADKLSPEEQEASRQALGAFLATLDRSFIDQLTP